MPRPAAPLLDLVVAGTWRADRHAKRLADEPLPKEPPGGRDHRAWERLIELQAAYVTAERPRERTAIAADFAAAVRALVKPAGGKEEMEQMLALSIGLCPNPGAYDHDRATDRAIRRRWRQWHRDHWRAWRDGIAGTPEPPPLHRDPTLRVRAVDRKPAKGGPIVILGLGGRKLRGAAARRYLERRELAKGPGP